MNPYRRRFQNHAEFPFEYVYWDTKSAQNELPDHVHDWYELVFVYTGRGTFFIDQTIYDAEPGDVFLIPGNTIHRSFPKPEEPKTSTALFFSSAFVHAAPLGDTFTYLLPFEAAKRRKSYRLSLDHEQQQQLIALIESLHDEHESKQQGYRQAVALYVRQMLLLLSRWIGSVTDSAEPGGVSASLPGWMSGILTYIDEHPGGALGLSELAGRCAVTPAHFSRVFKRLTGMNVTEYVTTKRILRAKELLLESDCSIAEIAERCGFDSLPHFHRKFRALTGMTPARFKQS